MKLLIYFGFALAALVIVTSPYVFLPILAQKKIPGDYYYIFPDYSTLRGTGNPNTICSANIYDLNSFYFLWSGANEIVTLYGYLSKPIHAAIYKDKQYFLWSFRSFDFVKMARSDFVYGEAFACKERFGVEY